MTAPILIVERILPESGVVIRGYSFDAALDVAGPRAQASHQTPGAAIRRGVHTGPVSAGRNASAQLFT